jgi:hypothetical protein
MFGYHVIKFFLIISKNEFFQKKYEKFVVNWNFNK